MSDVYGLLADLHFHPWSNFVAEPVDGLNSRLHGLLSELRRAAKSVCSAGGDNVVLAGDIFHVRGSVSPTVLNSVRHELAHCVREYGVRFTILAGNHDLESKNATRLSSAVTALEMEGVRVVNEPSLLGVGPNYALLMPWYDTVGNLKAALEDWVRDEDYMGLVLKDVDLILHAPIDGVIDGLPPHGLTGEYLAELGFKRVFAGHYHNHRLVYDGSSSTYATDVYSIGALAHHTWSDVGTKAGFLLVSNENVEWRKSHLPEFVDLKPDEANEDDLTSIVDGNYVRVRVGAVSSAEVEEIRSQLVSLGAKGVQVVATPEPVKRSSAGDSVSFSASSLEAAIGAFVTATTDAASASAVLAEALSVLSSADGMGLE